MTRSQALEQVPVRVHNGVVTAHALLGTRRRRPAATTLRARRLLRQIKPWYSLGQVCEVLGPPSTVQPSGFVFSYDSRPVQLTFMDGALTRVKLLTAR